MPIPRFCRTGGADGKRRLTARLTARLTGGRTGATYPGTAPGAAHRTVPGRTGHPFGTRRGPGQVSVVPQSSLTPWPLCPLRSRSERTRPETEAGTLSPTFSLTEW